MWGFESVRVYGCIGFGFGGFLKFRILRVTSPSPGANPPVPAEAAIFGACSGVPCSGALLLRSLRVFGAYIVAILINRSKPIGGSKSRLKLLGKP